MVTFKERQAMWRGGTDGANRFGLYPGKPPAVAKKAAYSDLPKAMSGRGFKGPVIETPPASGPEIQPKRIRHVGQTGYPK